MDNKCKKSWNIPFNLYNSLVLRKYPVSLTHFVTNRCNARCPHCFIDNENLHNELKLEQIEKIASTSGPALRNVSLTGGEPFLRDDIFEIADIWFKNTTLQSIALCTNGSMPDKIAEFAKKAVNIPVSFFFSYDFTEEKHSEYRKIKDLHLRLAESNKIVSKYYPKYNITYNITVTPDNYDSAYETYCYMRDVLKIQNINCTLIRGKKADNLQEKDKIAQTYKLIWENIDEDFKKGYIKGFKDKSLTAVLLNAKNRMLWKYVYKTFIENKFISPCFAGKLFTVLSPNGILYPCELISKSLGNLADFDYNLMKCYNSEDAINICNQISQSKCFCTFECCWLVNIFAYPKYYFELFYNVINNMNRNKCNDK